MTRKNPLPLLITGGAGHAGSHVLLAFRDAGDPATAAGVIREYGVEAVVHLAGRVRRQSTDCRGTRMPR